MVINSELENIVKERVNAVLEKYKISKSVIDITGTTDIGDGYASDVVFVDIKGLSKTNKEENLDLIIKISKNDKVLGNMTVLRPVYIREVFVYNHIFPQYEALQEKYNIANKFVSYPKCYDTFSEDERQIVVLENLKKLDYQLHNKRKPMNVQHLKLGFREYGKLHALSFALQKLEPEKFKELTSNIPPVFTEEVVLTANILDHLLNSMRESFTFFEENSEILKKYKAIEKDALSILTCSNHSENEKYNIICHGDGWNNNLMFKYEAGDTTNPIAVKLLDWQLSSLKFPVHDLSYFLYTCSSKDQLDHLDELQSEYYTSLTEFLKKFGLEVSEIYPQEVFKSQWKKYCKVGLIMVLVGLKVCLAEKSDEEANAQASEDFMSMLKVKVSDMEAYQERLKGVIQHFVEHDFI